MISLQNKKIEVLSADDLITRVNHPNDTLFVLNFWATWCKPCINEMPHFEKANKEFQNKLVKIILVNLDFNSQLEKHVAAFVAIKKYESLILHISDTDANSWINKIDSSWSGAIPATVFFKNKKKVYFHEGEMDYQTIYNTINKNL